MKRIVKFMLAPLLVLGMFITVFAASSPDIIVENQKLPVSGVSKNGRVLVPVRFIGESLGANVDWHNNTVLINSNRSAIKTSLDSNNGYDSSKVGNIKGSVTWQYNKFIGTKADTNAKIALIPTNLSKDSDNEELLGVLSQMSQGENGIYTTQADGYGNYEMQDIPAGTYYLLIISSNTNNTNKNRLYLIIML